MQSLKTFALILLGLCCSSAAAAPEISVGSGPGEDPVKLELSPQERSFLAAKKSIMMCVDPDWMPMERINAGRHEGIASDFIVLLEQRIATPIKLVITQDWQQSVEFAKARRCDIFSLAMSTPDRLEYMNFTRPYLRLPLVLATRKEQSYVSDVTLITDRTMGVVEDYAFAELLRKKYPQMDIRDVPSLREGMTMVERGELYGMIGTLASVGYLVQLGYPELKIAGKFDQYWELGVGVRNDQPLLFSALDKAVESIDKKTAQEILNRWISVKYERGVDYSLLWKLLPFIALVLAFGIYRQHLLKSHNLKLRELTETDPLTHAASRRKLDELLFAYADNYRRHGHTFSIIMVDLDNFKLVNDKHGHLKGDNALVEFCQRVDSRLRKLDTLGRWGGEEFLIICPNTYYTQACRLAEELRQLVAESDFAATGQQTASFGVAEFSDKDLTPEALVSRADNALYQAKEEGRNTVRGWTQE